MTPSDVPVPDAVAGLVRSALGCEVRAARPLTGGLALRRFLRLELSGPPHRIVARIEAEEDPAGRPAGVPPEPPLEPLRGFLESAGLPVARSLARDPALGIDLLEDLGDRSLADAARESDARRRALYARVVDWVPRLQRLSDPGDVPAFRRRLDAPLFAYKAALFARVSLPTALGREPRPSEASEVASAFAWIAERAAEAPARLAHRDLQSHNVLVRNDGTPVLIDLQGALLAPPEYDLVCLLRDSYLELAEAEVRAHLARVRPRLPDAPDPDAFAERFDWLTITRKAKDHARFLDVARRRGDASHLAHLPATVRALRAAAGRAAHRERRLATLAAWIDALPEEAPSCAP